MNQTVLVGKIVNKSKIEELENGKKVCTITISVPRNLKNMNGEYDIDFIDCMLWDGIAEKALDFCQKGSFVGVRGRLQRLDGEDLKVLAERVTFLSGKDEK